MEHTPINEIRSCIRSMGPCTAEFLGAKVEQNCPGHNDFPVGKVMQIVYAMNEIFVDDDGMIDLR